MRSWLVSDERKAFIDDAKVHSVEIRKLNQYGGSTEVAARLNLQTTMKSIPRPRPIPKWKIFLLTAFAVISINLLLYMNNAPKKMVESRIPTSTGIFLTVCHIVTFLTYSFLPIVQSIPMIKKWLKSLRLPSDQMWPFIRLLDEGLPLFQGTSNFSDMSSEFNEKINKLERRVNALRKMCRLVLSSCMNYYYYFLYP